MTWPYTLCISDGIEEKKIIFIIIPFGSLFVIKAGNQVILFVFKQNWIYNFCSYCEQNKWEIPSYLHKMYYLKWQCKPCWIPVCVKKKKKKWLLSLPRNISIEPTDILRYLNHSSRTELSWKLCQIDIQSIFVYTIRAYCTLKSIE